MTTAIAVQRTDVPDSVTEMMSVAKFLQHSAMLPKHLIGDPASLFAVMLKARALDIPMSTAFDNVIVQDGKTGMTGVLMQALVNRAGFSLYPVLSKCDRESATVLAEKPGIGPDRRGWDHITYTIEDAERAHLIERTKDGAVRARAKNNADFAKPWERYTADMLIWRAIGRGSRFYFNDVLMGIVHTPDELGATVDEEGKVVRVESIRVDLDERAAPYLLRISAAGDIDALRAVFDDIRDAGLLDTLCPEGMTLQEAVAARKRALVKAEQEAAEEAERVARRAKIEQARRAAMAGTETTTEPAPPADDSAAAHSAESDAPATDTEDTDTESSTGVVSHEPAGNPETDFDALDDTPADDPAPEAPAADTAPTPRRRGVLRVIDETFGSREAGEDAAVQHFQRPIDTIGTPELQEWLMDAMKAKTR